MLEGKGYKTLDIVFPLIAAFIIRATGYTDNANLTTVHTAHSDLPNKLLLKSARLTLINTHVSESKAPLKY